MKSPWQWEGELYDASVITVRRERAHNFNYTTRLGRCNFYFYFFYFLQSNDWWQVWLWCTSSSAVSDDDLYRFTVHSHRFLVAWFQFSTHYIFIHQIDLNTIFISMFFLIYFNYCTFKIYILIIFNRILVYLILSFVYFNICTFKTSVLVYVFFKLVIVCKILTRILYIIETY